ncbi:MAG: lactate racemase domain-containing protein [Fuerstiella sp.]
MKLQLTSGRISATVDLPQHATVHPGASAASASSVAQALLKPSGLPQLPQCVVPGDRVVIAVDPETPAISDVLTLVWEQFQSADTSLDVTVLLPADASGNNWSALLDSLPVHLRTQAAVQIHDPTDEQQRRYLASSAGGERIYLSHHLIDADLIVTVGVIGFDSLLGYRGTSSALFPAFADSESIRRARSVGHTELTPDDKRPQRELVDEIGWLLGTQFSVQVVPDAEGGVSQAFCGAVENVTSAGRAWLNQTWRCAVDEMADLAVISVPVPTAGPGWQQLGRALSAAASVVEDSGRIAVVAELPESVGPALEMLRRCGEPTDLLKPLRLEPPEDAVEVTQLIHALQRATVYLFSDLDPSFVEELGLMPLTSEAELQRLVDASDYPTVIPCANYAWPQVAESVRR